MKIERHHRGARFIVMGVPMPKPTGRRSTAGFRSFQASLKSQADLRFSTPMTGPIELSLAFFVPIPEHFGLAQKAAARAGRLFPLCEPELNEYVAAAEHSLTGIAWKDSGAVISYGYLYKRYDDGLGPRCCVDVVDLTNCSHLVPETSFSMGEPAETFWWKTC